MDSMFRSGVKCCAALSADYATCYPAPYERCRENRFWSRAAECAAQCRRLLADEPLRGEIACRGGERTRRNNHYNEPMLAALIEQAVRAFEGR